MAVKSFMKSSGLAALAAGLAAMAMPSAASAQHWLQGRGQGQSQVQAQQQAPQQQSNAGNWQGRGNGEARGNGGNWQNRGNGEARGNGGNWQNRGDGGWRQGGWERGRPQGQVQAAPQVQVAPQVRQRWGGGDRSAWREQQAQQQTQGQIRGTWPSQNRSWDGQRRWDGQNRAWDGQRRWDGNRSGYRGNYSRWNNDWRRDNRYNWYNYRNTNRNVFRLGRYYSPYSNWSYRRLGIGFMLQPLFYSQNYWIDDPWMYRLPEAYGPYRWVRYYDDALLVDIYSGEVVDAIHDFFW